MEQTDENGYFINVQLPGEETDMDLNKVILPKKYPQEIKIKDDKMADLLFMRKDLVNGGKWIDDLAERQKSGSLCQQSEEKCVSLFTEDTWGANNSMLREEVKKIDNPQHALIGNKEKQFKKSQKSRKARKASNDIQDDIDYAIEKTEEKLQPIYELQRTFKKKMKN